jgi:hypothetical protein
VAQDVVMIVLCVCVAYSSTNPAFHGEPSPCSMMLRATISFITGTPVPHACVAGMRRKADIQH